MLYDWFMKIRKIKLEKSIIRSLIHFSIFSSL